MLFLNIEGVAGNSMDAWHHQEFELNAFSWGMGDPQNGSGDSDSSFTMFDMSMTMAVSACTPPLIQACHDGQSFPQARLTQTTTGERPTDSMRITMRGVRVTTIALSAANNDRPTISLSLHFDEVTVECRDLNADGSLGPTGTCGPLLSNPLESSSA
nr:type VI secretion system tube protein Hcp [uncultured Albidiferax sp.]